MRRGIIYIRKDKTMKIGYFVYSIFIVSIVFLSSCDIFNEDVVIKMDRATFERERNLWNSQDIKNYQFVCDYFSDAGPKGPVRITVKENEEPVIENKNEFSEYIIAESIPEIYDFINGTFDFIETVKNGTYDGHKIRSVTLNITYNTQYHYPVEVDFSTGYVETVDGGAYYTLNISKFLPLD